MANDLQEIASAWFTRFSYSIGQKDAAETASLFHSDSWFRDLLVFTWDWRTLIGRENISKYFSANIESRAIAEFKLSSDDYFKPRAGQTPGSVTSGFTFATPIANGKGMFTLTPGLEPGTWKAFTVLMSLDSLKGHEPIGADQGMFHGHSFCWTEVREERRQKVEEDPHVLIVGAGQNGLQIAARFQQMGILTLLVDRNERVGDQWRQRYPSLTLRTTKQHHTLLYHRYPENWPRYTPRDKIADWLEQYAIAEDLVVWTKSQPLPTPSYNAETKKWTVSINKDGQIITIHPRHIVLATGSQGEPYIPPIEGHNTFKGQLLHSQFYSGGSQFSGKRVVIVGTGNSAADIALDLHVRFKAQSVTLLQRSSTCVQSTKAIGELLDHNWGLEVPTEIADYYSAATPFKLFKAILAGQKESVWAKDKNLLEGLASAGMNVNLGPDGAGVMALAIERGGGWWTDVGCAQYVLSGDIKVKSGVKIQKFSENTVFLDDGSALDADIVIFATGFHDIGGVLKQLFGNEIDQTGPVGSVDDEGEVEGAYRPTGHPGLWYAPGGFQASRFGSKYLAIQLQALELGYMEL